MQSPEQDNLTRQQALPSKAALNAVQGDSSCNKANVPADCASKQNATQRDAAEACLPAAETAADSQQHYTGHAGCMSVADAAAAVEQLGLAEDVTPVHCMMIINWWESAGRVQQQQQRSAAADTAEDQQPRAHRRKQRQGGVRGPGATAAGSSSKTGKRAWYQRLPEAREAFRQAAEECGCGSAAGCDAQQVIDYMKQGGDDGSNKEWPGFVEAAGMSASNCSHLLDDLHKFLRMSRSGPIDLKSRPEDRTYLIRFSTGGNATG